MTLLLYILECPQDPEAETDAQLLRGFGRQVRRIQDDGDCQISNLLKAYIGFEQLANIAISQAQNDGGLEAGAEPWQDAFPHDAVQVGNTLHPYSKHDLLTCLLDIQGVVNFSHSSHVLGPEPADQPDKPRYQNLPINRPHPRGTLR